MKRSLALLAFLCIISFSSFAEIRLPAIFADSMVLQQSMMVPVWGWAAPGEKITVSASWPNAGSVSATAGADGKWMVKIKTPAAGGPFDLSIKGSQSITFRGVLIGEVWICSGQSNMEMPVRGWLPNDPIKNSAEEIATANHSRIRFFTVKKNIAYSPVDDVSGKWASCNPASTADFSAIAYFFGRELSKNLNVPIGLISTNWGGTIAEAWTSADGLKPVKDFDAAVLKIDSLKKNMKQLVEEDKQNELKWNQMIQESNSAFVSDADNSSWKSMTLPALWESKGLPDLDGIVWFKKEVTIPAAWAGKNLKLDLGPIDDNDITWINGQVVDSTMKSGSYAVNRNYSVKGNLVKAGKNILTVKVLDNAGSGGIYGEAAQLRLYPADGKPEDGISLAGDWIYKVQATKPRPPVTNSPNQVTVLYNGMIAPLVPYAIKGAIWYQGESNVDRAAQYERLFPAMIGDWRKQWNQGNFPFYFVQIAPYKYAGDSTRAAALRDAQRKTLTASPNTGMAVTLDLGNPKNIHPADKQEPARRLALWALTQTYSKKISTYTGPLYENFKVTNKQVTVSFTNTEGGLKTLNKPLDGFELAGPDNQWKPAKATIKGNTVVVESDSVTEPKAVRYAFTATSEASLFNGAGLPASSFSSAQNK